MYDQNFLDQTRDWEKPWSQTKSNGIKTVATVDHSLAA